jgi:hypothetical protein
MPCMRMHTRTSNLSSVIGRGRVTPTTPLLRPALLKFEVPTVCKFINLRERLTSYEARTQLRYNVYLLSVFCFFGTILRKSHMRPCGAN